MTNQEVVADQISLLNNEEAPNSVPALKFTQKTVASCRCRPIDTTSEDYSDDRRRQDETIDESKRQTTTTTSEEDEDEDDFDIDALVWRAFADFKSRKLSVAGRQEDESSLQEKAQKKDFLKKFGLTIWTESADKESSTATSKGDYHHQLLRDRGHSMKSGDESKQVLTKYTSLVGVGGLDDGPEMEAVEATAGEKTKTDHRAVSSKSLSPPMTRKRARLSNYNLVTTVNDGAAKKSSFTTFYDEISFKNSLSRKFKKSAAALSSVGQQQQSHQALKKRGHH